MFPAGAVPLSSQPASDVDGIRQQMETQINTLQRQLQGEREKMLLQTVRAKEEEVMAAKVEESLKDIQDRLRREKREQELQETLTKTENQVRELEQRIQTERQTWVETLKTQLSQRESQDRELEHTFRTQLKELEHRWHEEKLAWSQAVKRKDEEIARLKKEMETAIAAERTVAEKRLTQLENERESLKRELKDTADVRQEERGNLLEKLENRDKEYLGIKAQQAMIVTQLRQEKEKAEQLRTLLEKFKAERTALSSRYENKEKEFYLFKTQFAMYQTRAKSEQEKLLKEMVLFKDQIQKERQQFEVALRAKDHETGMMQQNAREKETDLKALVDKKEQEINALVRQYEERVKARESELRYLFEKKESEYQVLIKQQEEKLVQKEQSFILMLGQKDSEIKALQLHWQEKLGSKEKELTLMLDKERDYKVTLAQQAQQLFELREKVNTKAGEILQERETAARKERELSELVARKEIILEKDRAQWLEKIEKKEKEIAEIVDRERNLKNTLAQYEHQVREFQARIDTQARAAADERVRFEQKEREMVALIAAKDNDFKITVAQWAEKVNAKNQEMNVVVSAKENEIKMRDDQWAQRLAAREKDMAAATEQEKFLRLSILQSEQKVKDLEREIARNNASESQLAQKLADREKELSAAAEQEKTLHLTLQQNEQKAKNLEHTIDTLEREIARNKELIAREEREQAQFSATFHDEKKLLGEQFAQERTQLLAQISAATEEYRRIMVSRDESQRALEQRERDAEKLRSEFQLKSKDAEIEAARKEFQNRQETSALQEKIDALETQLADKEKEFNREVNSRECELRKQEEAAAAERLTHETTLAALHSEVDGLCREKENVLREKEQVVQAASAEVLELKRRLHEEREAGEHLAREKEQELAQIRADRYTYEAEVRRTMEQKYRASIDQLEMENNEMHRDIDRKYRGVIEQLKKEQETTVQNVAQEITAIRNALRAEMQSVEDQFEHERVDFRNKLQERDAAVAGAQEQAAEHERRLTQEHTAWETQKELLLKQNNDDKTTIEKIEKRYDELMTNYEEIEYELMTRKGNSTVGDEQKAALSQQNEEQRIALEKLEKRYDDLMTNFEEIEYELMVKNKEIATVHDSVIVERREPKASDGPAAYIAQTTGNDTIAIPVMETAPPAVSDKTVVLPVTGTPPAAINPAVIINPLLLESPGSRRRGATGGGREVGGYFSRFWSDINKPVIEINVKAKKELKN
jgi:hypothetical protein